MWRHYNYTIGFLFIFILVSKNSVAQRGGAATRDRWVDSVYQSLTIDERIGQLFMVAAYSAGPKYNRTELQRLIDSSQIGGLIFMQGTAEAQAYLTNSFQASAKTPLLIGMDAEWGLGMRLTGVRDMPKAMMLGATCDTLLVYEVAAAIARQCKRLGVHIDFAPVADINNNPRNPVINARSFGENKMLATQMARAYMRGLQDNGVIACAKHFPGHGDTDADSHSELPIISKSLSQLDTLELYPFRQLINAGIKSVMVAHLEVPAIEFTKGVPTTLSYGTISNLLQIKMGFQGLVFTDALNMQAVARTNAPGDVELKAFMAGNDVLLFSQNVPLSIRRFKEALVSGYLSEMRLRRSVIKILKAKWEAGLHLPSFVDSANATAALNQETDGLRRKVFVKAITHISQVGQHLPNLLAPGLRLLFVGVNADSSIVFKEIKKKAPGIRAIWLPKGGNERKLTEVLHELAECDVAIVSINNLTFYPGSEGNHGLDKSQTSFLTAVDSCRKVIVVNFGNAYLNKLYCRANHVVQVYEDDSIAQVITSKVLLGLQEARGRLPVTPGCGTATRDALPITTLSDAKSPSAVKSMTLRQVIYPEDAGVKRPEALRDLRLFLQRAISSGAFPGCRVLAAKDGAILFDEAFGFLDYQKGEAVTNNTMYDIASVTKVAATTLAVMKLWEEGKIDLDRTIVGYLPWLVGSNKAGLKVRELLLHQGGLKSWIPFYKETMSPTNQLLESVYAKNATGPYTIHVATDLYMNRAYRDTIWRRILESPVNPNPTYIYSDLDFYFLEAVVVAVAGMPLDQYLNHHFYKPLGLKRTSFNPLDNGFSIADVAPTERDELFRKHVVRGFVHDPGAAMLGGVAGHAGLFCSAPDLAVIFQMLINGGVYQSKRYFKEETVRLFTSSQSLISRRGLGFDKPEKEIGVEGPTALEASLSTFGHQGFTGTCAWADPDEGIVFIFLSNRVNPSADNKLINKMNVRTEAQSYIYKSLGLSGSKRP